MNNYILYLTKDPLSTENRLIFPSDIDDKNYYGVGGFYIDNHYTQKLSNSYVIHAIKDEEIIEITITKKDKSRFFTCTVENIGTFVFYAEKLNSANSQNYRDYNITYRLKLWNTEHVEYSALEYKFYFIGYTDIIEGQQNLGEK